MHSLLITVLATLLEFFLDLEIIELVHSLAVTIATPTLLSSLSIRMLWPNTSGGLSQEPSYLKSTGG